VHRRILHGKEHRIVVLTKGDAGAQQDSGEQGNGLFEHVGHIDFLFPAQRLRSFESDLQSGFFAVFRRFFNL
jgi:hypothetical protein